MPKKRWGEGLYELAETVEAINSAIADLDPRGDNDTVTMAMTIVSMARDLIVQGKKVVPDKIFQAALADFQESYGREPELR